MIYSFPENYGEGCYVVLVDKALVPLVAGALRIFEERRTWATDQDYEQGYNAFAELQACMTMLCVKDLIAAQDRVYRLLDTTLNGAEYVADELNGEIIVTPPIPPAPAPVAMSIHRRLERLEQLFDNSFNGTEYLPDLNNTMSVRTRLEDILAAIGAGEANDEELLAVLQQVVVLLA